MNMAAWPTTRGPRTPGDDGSPGPQVRT
jgi:hypothetical protein